MCVPVNAESLKEMWSNPARDTYASEKTSLELETCLGEELSEHGIPSVLHGEQYNTVSLYHAYSRSLQLSVRILDHGSTRSDENTSELQSLMRLSHAVSC